MAQRKREVNFPVSPKLNCSAGSVAFAENLDGKVSFTINLIIIRGGESVIAIKFRLN
jgi:hypothetical protein